VHFKVITLFPEQILALSHSIPARAQSAGAVQITTIPLRNYAINKHGQVDDYPYGGEAGMVLRPEPVYDALKANDCLEGKSHVVLMSPAGNVFNHQKAMQWSQKSSITLICGHYKGLDERVIEEYVDEEVSIGDFILSGGELAAMVCMDSVIRLLPGVLGDKESAETDSFYNGLLGWPVYTRPESFMGKKVPDILLSGHHENIKEWRITQSQQRTQVRRPDLWENFKDNKK
jgi:tRNA (guanine37-N1)-methyltransferase